MRWEMPEQPRSELELSRLVDVELARLAREGSVSALRLIVRRHNQRLYRVARAIVRDDAEAEDVLQEVYLSAFANLARFVNKAVGRLRPERMMVPLDRIDEPQRMQGEIGLSDLASRVDPERSAAQSQVRALLEHAIDNLPEPFRVVFVMRMVEQLSVRETASSLGIPEDTVKTRLHRAKKLMREQLEGAVDWLAIDRELGAVAGAVPALLEVVPMDDAVRVRAHRRAKVNLSGLVSVGGDLRRPLPDHGPLARLDLVDGRDVPAGHILGEVGDHGRVLTDVLGGGAQRDALRRIGASPRIVAPENKVAQQEPRDHSRRQPFAGVAGRNVDPRVAVVPADVGCVVDRLQNLAGPAVLDRSGRREMEAGPRLQPRHWPARRNRPWRLR